MMPGETEMSVTVNVSFELEEADCGLPRALVARAVGKRPGPSPAGPFDRSAHRAAPEQIHDREQNDRAEQRDQQRAKREAARSEEHTSELQSLMRISYAVFCLKKKKINNNIKQKKHKKKTS